MVRPSGHDIDSLRPADTCWIATADGISTHSYLPSLRRHHSMMQYRYVCKAQATNYLLGSMSTVQLLGCRGWP